MRLTVPLVVVLAGWTLPGWAQEPSFTSKAHEVLVPVAVVTKAGKPVENLAADDFVVLSDGKPQAVRMIARDSDTLLIHAVIVLQISDSSEAALAKIRKTASVVSYYITNDMQLGPPSLAAVVSAGNEVKVEQNFTADPYVLGDVFTKLTPGGDSGRLLDGVSLACDLLAARKEPGAAGDCADQRVTRSRDQGALHRRRAESATGRCCYLYGFLFALLDGIHSEGI